MKIYISGPMTGYPDLNFPAFESAAQDLRARGFDVVSPHELNPDPSADWHSCMRVDIKALMDCHKVVRLVGYEKSKGASLELHIAELLEMVIEDYVSVQGRNPTEAVDANRIYL